MYNTNELITKLNDEIVPNVSSEHQTLISCTTHQLIGMQVLLVEALKQLGKADAGDDWLVEEIRKIV